MLAVAAILVSLPLAATDDASRAAADPCSAIEYRLETTADEPGSRDFAWWDGDPTRRLAARAFLDAADLAGASLRASRASPGRWEIDLEHTPSGAVKFDAVGNADRDRQFAILIGGKIVQGYAFPPFHKDVYAAGTSVNSLPKDVAERLLREARDAIGACAATAPP